MIRQTPLARRASEVRADDAESLTAEEARVRSESIARVQEPEVLLASACCPLPHQVGPRRCQVAFHQMLVPRRVLPRRADQLRQATVRTLCPKTSCIPDPIPILQFPTGQNIRKTPAIIFGTHKSLSSSPLVSFGIDECARSAHSSDLGKASGPRMRAAAARRVSPVAMRRTSDLANSGGRDGKKCRARLHHALQAAERIRRGPDGGLFS